MNSISATAVTSGTRIGFHRPSARAAPVASATRPAGYFARPAGFFRYLKNSEFGSRISRSPCSLKLCR